ncbi:hypothetical protein ACPZ19_10445 [Amycolatopsis lurida]
MVAPFRRLKRFVRGFVSGVHAGNGILHGVRARDTSPPKRSRRDGQVSPGPRPRIEGDRT